MNTTFVAVCQLSADINRLMTLLACHGVSREARVQLLHLSEQLAPVLAAAALGLPDVDWCVEYVRTKFQEFCTEWQVEALIADAYGQRTALAAVSLRRDDTVALRELSNALDDAIGEAVQQLDDLLLREDPSDPAWRAEEHQLLSELILTTETAIAIDRTCKRSRALRGT